MTLNTLPSIENTMRPLLLTAYFKWGHKKNRQLLTVSLLLAMTVSVGMQGRNLFDVIDLSNTTQKTAPLPVSQTPRVKQEDFKLLFGSNERPEARADKADIPKTRLSLVLRGALAGLENGRYASAIIQGSNQDKLYEVGDALPGGVTLSEVHSDYVVLNRGGQLETLYFPDTGKDSRALQEYKAPVETKSGGDVRPGYNETPDGKSLEQRMQDLREKLQQANQGN